MAEFEEIDDAENSLCDCKLAFRSTTILRDWK